MMSIQELIWSDLEQYARSIYTAPSFQTWFTPAYLEGIDLERRKIIIHVPSDIVSTRWQDDLVPKLIELAFKHTQYNLVPEFTYPNMATTIPSNDSSVRSDHPEEVRGTPLDPNYTFDNFVIGPNNQLAQAGALTIADDLGGVYNPFIIHGGTGLGKTHLMQAIGHEVLKNNPSAHIMNVSCEKFVNDFITSIRQSGQNKNVMDEFRNAYRTVDLLLIDDIQFLENKEETQTEFFHTFNELTNNHKQIVMTSDRPISKIPQLQDRLISRFQRGTSCTVTAPDLDTRVAILREKMALQGIDLPDDTVEYIADHVTANVRELEGALAKLKLYINTTHNTDITPAIATKALSEMHEESRHADVSIVEIQEKVAQYFNLSISDLKGKKRTKAILVPRQIAMFLARELTDTSLPKIGSAFGGKDHTTVMHACERIKSQLLEDEKLKHDVQEIKNLL